MLKRKNTGEAAQKPWCNITEKQLDISAILLWLIFTFWNILKENGEKRMENIEQTAVALNWVCITTYSDVRVLQCFHSNGVCHDQPSLGELTPGHVAEGLCGTVPGLMGHWSKISLFIYMDGKVDGSREGGGRRRGCGEWRWLHLQVSIYHSLVTQKALLPLESQAVTVTVVYVTDCVWHACTSSFCHDLLMRWYWLSSVLKGSIPLPLSCSPKCRVQTGDIQPPWEQEV